uniref:uncharacterized protein LOC100181318 isoform X2 n=1 Tax=Ciona intestinalis TaxID=7719 RepID=UPI000EF4A6FB|nr:uncharacterized protein LOC100181318 isoform X2 [Ciona intestinalis]|eukprot:XP_026690507.1 uncharacterized protein LOC100181318 isoform X2 [Ciona intestinalis]
MLIINHSVTLQQPRMKSVVAVILVICFAAFADASVLKSVAKIGAKVVDATLPLVAKAGPHIDTGDYVHNDPDWRSWKTLPWDQREKNAAQMLDESNAEAIEALLQD